jgi:hypothetical protein
MAGAVDLPVADRGRVAAEVLPAQATVGEDPDLGAALVAWISSSAAFSDGFPAGRTARASGKRTSRRM